MRRTFPVVMGLAVAACATTSQQQPEPAKAMVASEAFQARLDSRSEVPPPALDAGLICAAQKVEHYETKRRRKDGTVIDVSLAVSPIKTPDGETVGARAFGSRGGKAPDCARIARRSRSVADVPPGRPA